APAQRCDVETVDFANVLSAGIARTAGGSIADDLALVLGDEDASAGARGLTLAAEKALPALGAALEGLGLEPGLRKDVAIGVAPGGDVDLGDSRGVGDGGSANDDRHAGFAQDSSRIA